MAVAIYNHSEKYNKLAKQLQLGLPQGTEDFAEFGCLAVHKQEGAEYFSGKPDGAYDSGHHQGDAKHKLPGGNISAAQPYNDGYRCRQREEC